MLAVSAVALKKTSGKYKYIHMPLGLKLLVENQDGVDRIDLEMLRGVLRLHYPEFTLEKSADATLRLSFFDPTQHKHRETLDSLCLGNPSPNCRDDFNYANVGPRARARASARASAKESHNEYQVYINRASWMRNDGYFGPREAPMTQDEYRYAYMLPHELGHALRAYDHVEKGGNEDDQSTCPIMMQQSGKPWLHACRPARL